MDPPLVKKFGVYNSGIVPPERYTPAVINSLGTVKAASLRQDLSIGKDNTGYSRLFDMDSSGSLVYNFSAVDNLVAGLQAVKVPPYWSLTYAPKPFQAPCPGGIGSEECQNSKTTCLGFEDQAHVPGTNNYSCIPPGANPWDDCWKCPPKMKQDDSYETWSSMVAGFHAHLLQSNISPMYEEHWNEPDLTEYYNPTVATFKGSSKDYNAAYMACESKLTEVDPDVMFGGIAAANQIRRNLDYPLQPSCEDILIDAAGSRANLDFLSYHSITTSPGANQIQLVIDRAQTAREVLSTQELLNITGQLNPYNTTEVHCNEFFPNSTVATLTVNFSGSPYLASLLLESFYHFLEERDLMQVHWAQYMDIYNTDDQIGLLSYAGNPRPPWWTFKWYAEMPEERVELILDSQNVRGMASYSSRSSAGGVLLWNIPNPTFGYPAKDGIVNITMTGLAQTPFNIEAYIIDEKRRPGVGFNYTPSAVFASQTPDSTGTYIFPPEEYNGLRVPVNGSIYLKITSIPPVVTASSVEHLPESQILRTHHYFGKRPDRTTMYGYFQPASWSAYLGMGSEVEGFAIAGATIRLDTDYPEVLQISFDMAAGGLNTTGMYGVRVDFASRPVNDSTDRSTYQSDDSYFFYQQGQQPCASPPAPAQLPNLPQGTYSLDLSQGQESSGQVDNTVDTVNRSGSLMYASDNVLSTYGRKLRLSSSAENLCGNKGIAAVPMQIPSLWGSKQPVDSENFLPVNLSSFQIDPSHMAPGEWDGRMVLLFVLKDGEQHSVANAYVTAA